MIVENRRARAHIDYPLIIMVFGLALFGLLAVSVATYSTSSSSDASLLTHLATSSYAMRQLLYVFLAIVIISVMLAIPYEMYYRYVHVFYLAATGLVLFTLVTNRAAGVKAWTDLIWGYTIQPSEFIKLAMILFLAKYFSRFDHPLSNGRQFVETAVYAGFPMVVILASGEMGSMLVMVFIVAMMLFFANTRPSTLAILGLAAVLALALLYGYMVTFNADSYRLARVLAFIDPASYSSTDAYQQTQSKIAIGSGGLFGIGMFVDGALSQLNYVPADWTDFIFATIGEAWGFVGCVTLLVVYLLVILRMLYLAYYTRDRFGRLVILGVMSMLLFHVFENIAMTIGLMPITGIPLPFISYGGSNMVTNMAGVGLVLMVTKNRSAATHVNVPQREASVKWYRRRRGIAK